MNLQQSFLEVRKKLQQSKSTFICYDTDADGFTSYLQLKNAFSEVKGKPFAKSSKYQEHLVEEILQGDFDVVLFIDTPVIEEFVFESLKKKMLIWVDHHPSNDKKLIEKYTVFHLNPLEFNQKDNRPASYLAYEIAGLKENLGLCVLGSISDFFLLPQIIDLYEKDKVIFDLFFNLEENKFKEIIDFIRKDNLEEESFREKRGEYIRELSYGGVLIEYKNLIDIMFKLKPSYQIDLAVELLQKLSLKEILIEMNAGKGLLFEDYALMKSKYKNLLLKAQEKKREDRIFYEKLSKTSFSRQISEELVYLNPKIGFVCVCFKKPGGDFYSCSLRGNLISVKEVLDFSLQNLKNSSGGGHKYAVGVRVHKEEFDKFKKKVLDF